MHCNFYSNHKSIFQRIEWTWEIFSFSLYALGCSLCAMFVSLGLSVNYTDGMIEYNNFSFTPILITLLLGYPLFKLIVVYKKYRKNKRGFAEFTYKMFKDWYSLSPKRFIFDREGYGFHYMINGNPDYVNEVFRVSSFSDKEWYRIDSNYNYLVPKTFLDYLRFTVFVEFLFRGLEGKANKQRRNEIQKRNNEELLAVLNVVQSDIEKVLRDSQNKLNEEGKKLEAFCK